MASFGNMTSQMGNANQVLGQPTALNQVGPGSPTFNPALFPTPPLSNTSPMSPQPGQPMIPQIAPPQPPMPPQTPQMPQQPASPMPGSQQGVVGTPPGVPETQMILKALISRMETHNKHEAAIRDALLPPRI